MNQILNDALNGSLTSSSQAALCDLLMDYIRTGELHLPSNKAFLKQVRDSHVVAAWELCPGISQAEFYQLFQDSKREPMPNDVITLMLHQVHLLNEQYDLSTPSKSTVRRIVAE